MPTKILHLLDNGDGTYTLVKFTPQDNNFKIVPSENISADEIFTVINEYFDTSDENIFSKTSDDSTIVISENNVDRNFINILNAEKICTALNTKGLIKDFTFSTNFDTVEYGKLIPYKYPAEYKEAIENYINSDEFKEYQNIWSMSYSVSESEEDYICVKNNNTESSNNLDAVQMIYENCNAIPYFSYDNSETMIKNGLVYTFEELSRTSEPSEFVPQVTTTDKNALEYLRRMLSSSEDFSDGKPLYIGSEYKVDCDDKGNIIIYGIKQEECSKDISDIIKVNGDISDMYLNPYGGEKKIFSGMSVEIFPKAIKIFNSFNIETYVENELPTKDGSTTEQRTIEELEEMQSQTGNNILQYIFSNENININKNILSEIVNKIVPTYKYDSGDVNGDVIVDLTDLTELSLYLLGDKKFNDAQMAAADVNTNGNVDIADLAYFKLYLNGTEEIFLGR